MGKYVVFPTYLLLSLYINMWPFEVWQKAMEKQQGLLEWPVSQVAAGFSPYFPMRWFLQDLPQKGSIKILGFCVTQSYVVVVELLRYKLRYHSGYVKFCDFCFGSPGSAQGCAAIPLKHFLSTVTNLCVCNIDCWIPESVSKS